MLVGYAGQTVSPSQFSSGLESKVCVQVCVFPPCFTRRSSGICLFGVCGCFACMYVHCLCACRGRQILLLRTDPLKLKQLVTLRASLLVWKDKCPQFKEHRNHAHSSLLLLLLFVAVVVVCCCCCGGWW